MPKFRVTSTDPLADTTRTIEDAENIEEMAKRMVAELNDEMTAPAGVSIRKMVLVWDDGSVVGKITISEMGDDR